MAEAISNTSPLFYLHQVGALEWLPRLFPPFEFQVRVERVD